MIVVHACGAWSQSTWTRRQYQLRSSNVLHV